MLIIQFSHVDYITSKQGGSGYARRSFLLNEYEPDVKSKVYLLKHFERYIMDRLYGEYSFTFEDLDRTRGLDFVQKYLRMKHVIVFKMSHDVLQVGNRITGTNIHADRCFSLTSMTIRS